MARLPSPVPRPTMGGLVIGRNLRRAARPPRSEHTCTFGPESDVSRASSGWKALMVGGGFAEETLHAALHRSDVGIEDHLRGSSLAVGCDALVGGVAGPSLPVARTPVSRTANEQAATSSAAQTTFGVRDVVAISIPTLSGSSITTTRIARNRSRRITAANCSAPGRNVTSQAW